MDNLHRPGESILIGDFNLDMSKRDSPKVKKLLKVCSKNSLESYIHSCTRITRKSATTIDLIFSDFGYVSHSGTIDTNISDHLPIYLVKKKSCTSKTYVEVEGRSYKNLDRDQFDADIKAIDLSDVLGRCGPDVIWDTFYQRAVEVLDIHCPIKKLRLYTDRAGFITTDLEKLIHMRDKSYSKARRSGLTEDWNSARSIRDKVRRDLNKAKKDYVARLIDQSNGDSKKFWRVLGDTFLKMKSANIDCIYKQGTTDVIYGAEAADEINRFFCNVSTELARKFPDLPDIPDPDYSVSRNYLIRGPLDIDSVLTQIRKIDVGKASGLIEMNSRILKTILLAVPQLFTDILNLCLEHAIFPNSWKVAIIVALPKKGNAKELNNLRPLSLLPVQGKILEFFLNQEIMAHLEDNQLLADEQMGFRGGRSTVEGCLGLVDEIIKSNDDGKLSIVVFVDLAKAFNTVSLPLLLQKMANFGFPKRIVDMLRSYLRD